MRSLGYDDSCIVDAARLGCYFLCYRNSSGPARIRYLELGQVSLQQSKVVTKSKVVIGHLNGNFDNWWVVCDRGNRVFFLGNTVRA